MHEEFVESYYMLLCDYLQQNSDNQGEAMAELHNLCVSIANLEELCRFPLPLSCTLHGAKLIYNQTYLSVRCCYICGINCCLLQCMFTLSWIWVVKEVAITAFKFKNLISFVGFLITKEETWSILHVQRLQYNVKEGTYRTFNTGTSTS